MTTEDKLADLEHRLTKIEEYMWDLGRRLAALERRPESIPYPLPPYRMGRKTHTPWR